MGRQELESAHSPSPTPISDGQEASSPNVLTRQPIQDYYYRVGRLYK